MTTLSGKLKKLNELKHNSNAYRKELNNIQKRKIKEIINCLYSLYIILRTFEEYPDSEGYTFQSFKKKIIETRIKEQEYIHDEILYFIGDFAQKDDFDAIAYRDKLISNMLSQEFVLEYHHMNHIYDIYNHLFALFCYFPNKMNYPPTLADLLLDISLIKLVGYAGIIYTGIYKKGDRELLRIKMAIESQKNISDEKKTNIIEIYYRSSQIKPGMSFNRVATIISDEFKKLQEKGVISKQIKNKANKFIRLEPPSVDTIKRYLSTDAKIIQDFIKQGRRLILQT
jgi:hypothetical protein